MTRAEFAALKMSLQIQGDDSPTGKNEHYQLVDDEVVFWVEVPGPFSPLTKLHDLPQVREHFKHWNSIKEFDGQRFFPIDGTNDSPSYRLGIAFCDPIFDPESALASA